MFKKIKSAAESAQASIEKAKSDPLASAGHAVSSVMYLSAAAIAAAGGASTPAGKAGLAIHGAMAYGFDHVEKLRDAAAKLMPPVDA